MRAPFHAGAKLQLLQREFLEWIKRHPGRLSRGGASPIQAVPKTCFGIVNGKSTELSNPGSAATTYGTALTTRIAVATIAPAPEVIPPTPALRGSFSVAAIVQSMSGSPVIMT